MCCCLTLPAIIALAGVKTCTADDSKPVEKITSFGNVPDKYKIIDKSLYFSPDMRHVTYVASKGLYEKIVKYDNKIFGPYYAIHVKTPRITPKTGKHYFIGYKGPGGEKVSVVINGKEGPTFDAIDNLIFSPDEESFLYRAKKGDKQCIVINNRPGPFYDGIVVFKNLLFSPDSKRIAYVAYKKDQGCILVLDGKETASYGLIKEIIFSPDSKRIAYKARKEKKDSREKWCVVTDGKEGPVFDEIASMLFSPDSKHIAYVGLRGRAMDLIYDGSVMATWPVIAQFVFSPDGKRFAYLYSDSKKWRWVIDGTPQQWFDYPDQFFFTSDSAHVVYSMVIDKKAYVAFDGTTSTGYEKVKGLVVSEKSGRYAYSAVLDSGDQKGCVVVDGEQGPLFVSVGTPHFSKDGKHIAYRFWSSESKKWAVMYDGRPSKNSYLEIEDITFSINGDHIGYKALKSKPLKWTVVVDGVEQGYFKGVSKPWFSADGKHMAFAAGVTPDEWHVIVDGIMLDAKFAGFLKGTPFFFDPEHQNRMCTIGFLSFSPTYEMARIEVDIPESIDIQNALKPESNK